MYERSQFIPQGLSQNLNLHARNLIDNPYLPIINTRNQIMAEEQYKHANNSLNYINNRAQRSMKFISKNNNFPMYDQGIFQLANHFPQNMLNFRPIRYFFQRPVYVDTSQPEVRQMIAERKTDRFVAETVDKANKAYAIPLKYEDLIKNGEVLNQALAKVIDPKEVQDQLLNIDKQKHERMLKRENEVHIGKERVLKRRDATKARIKKLSKNVKMFCFYKIYIKFSMSLKYIRTNEDKISQSAKANLDEITTFVVQLLKTHLEDYFIKNLWKKIELTQRNSGIIDNYNGNPSNNNNNTPDENVEYIPTVKDKKANPFFKENRKEKVTILPENNKKNISAEKVENSIFILKTTIHNIMNVLSSNINKAEDLPEKIKKSLRNFIADGALLPKNFLTSLEFNRLEWSLRVKLIRMKSEKKAMMVSTIFLYRVLIMNVLMNIFKYFPQFKQIIEVKNVDNNIEYNLKLIGYILSKIFKDSIPRPKIFREHFKDKHLFDHFVINGNSKNKDNILKEDQFELEKMLLNCQEGDEFLVNNYKWVTLYKLSASSLCMNMVEYIN